jgi:uncharacterized protein (DUF433 family)
MDERGSEGIMNLPDFLVEWPFGEIVVKGHRIGLYDVIDRYQSGLTPEEILERFPSLSVEKISNVLAFYHENRAEVDAYLEGCRKEMEEFRAAFPRRATKDDLIRYFASKNQSPKG